MSNSDNGAKWPKRVVIAHFAIASLVIAVITLTDSKGSDTERKLRQTLELQKQSLDRQSDEIAKLRHQLLVLAAQCDALPDSGSGGDDE